jgi:hypothetical protein
MLQAKRYAVMASFMALLSSAIAQSAAAQSATPASTPPPAPSSPKGPSFQSAGLKITVVDTSTATTTITLSLILENTGSADALVAVIGPPIAINTGQTFVGSTVGGVASCMVSADQPRSAQIKSCLAGPDPTLPVQQFTFLEHGNATPLTISFQGAFNMKVDKGQPISFAMTVATARDSDSSTSGGETLQTSASPKATDTTSIPANLRFVSLGIAAIPPSDPSQ